YLTLAIVALVVVRFLFRELRNRVVRVRTLWIRPGLFAVASVLLLAFAFKVPDVSIAIAALAAIGGAVVGVVTGTLVLRSTTFTPAGLRGAVRAKGNATTVAIWVIAIALRFAARYAFADLGASAAVQYELNLGLVVLVTAAFIVVARGFHRAIDRLAPEQA
ncbi:MAG: hypothetical protein JO225_05440, partial [Candidatus Eremiobacteraeota bacterium]|nr:hypothetical protein [Candidatus Eremiobacteraeota bacterium]